MKFNLAKLIQFIVAEIDTFKEVGEHGKAIYDLIKGLVDKYNEDGRVVMSATEDDAALLAGQNPVLNRMAAACVEFDSVDEMTAMRGPGAILQLLKLLAQYGPLILELIDALRDE